MGRTIVYQGDKDESIEEVTFKERIKEQVGGYQAGF